MFGVPDALLSDRGANLLAHVMQDVSQLLGVKNFKDDVIPGDRSQKKQPARLMQNSTCRSGRTG
jgi:hypothetical protein